ncbi:CpaF family protein [Bdellovibrio svalbardensis]|uniref:ATPase, T2SS/T4P/T4SS family n=1 Tax=Bdellovibrio svalbardensis TaxID=2972972 RepID=A0ABT6DF48_9BACT|nr:ATPase, T2SS/T4P/T4SS family [Bdellovibrio svalbardensis]MDG0815451.1 ATPase, T2SS/T4P/T4SS family [Bdellovibrio svalbardensis]
MIQEAKKTYNLIQNEIGLLKINEYMLSSDDESVLRSNRIDSIINDKTQRLASEVKARVCAEFESWGPLDSLLADENITEILINGPSHIWFEKEGRLFPHEDSFFSELSFRNCLERICQQAKTHISVEHPCADGQFLEFRLSLIGTDLTKSAPHLALRRHPKNPWTFAKLADKGWCDPQWLPFFQKLVDQRKSFLVVGSTGSGKTSVLNSFLNLLPSNERVVVIEDTPEIALPNTACMKLLTREDPHGLLPTVDQTQLVKRALRLRPDRIAMGEVRGAEAKDFLMALATGHSGSFGTLHAQDASQALIRLEMLIQMGAPQWSLSAIRRLIQLSLDYVVVTERVASGERKFKGAYRLCSLEDQGFLIEPVELPL